MKYFLYILLLVSNIAFSEGQVCEDIDTLQYSSCLSDTLNKNKADVNRLYSEIINKFNDDIFKELKTNVEKSHIDWLKTIENDCKSYAYFIEITSPVYQDEYNLCLLNGYKSRSSYYQMMLDMYDTFI